MVSSTFRKHGAQRNSRMATNETFPSESVRSAIAELWRASHRDEQRACKSAAFRLLIRNCRSAYFSLKGSRLQQSFSSALQPTALESALLCFFRWCGAPWNDSNCPTADDVALRLHQALLTPDINRVYLVPLDQLRLQPRPDNLLRASENIHFGPNEVLSMTGADLRRLVPIDGISRFGPQYAFPAEQLYGLFWLVVTARENAGSLWMRTPFHWFHEATYRAIGETRLYEPSYPAPVEAALFVLLLTLAKQPTEIPWRPFVVPWIYSFTDDPFAEPQRVPELSALTWTLVGDSGDELLVPDQPCSFQITEQALDGLRRRQSDFETASAESGSYGANLSALVPHFFVRAFAEDGIHEIITNLSCVEATLMLRDERRRKHVYDRLAVLTGNQQAGQWLASGYRLRDAFLHSLGQPSDSVDSRELARLRWSVSQAVGQYLSFASKHRDRSRDDLLRLLSSRRE